MPKKKKIRKRETDLFHSHMKDPNVRNTIARDRERETHVGKRGGSFPVLALYFCALYLSQVSGFY